MNTPKHYDNTNGSLYKIAEQRGWNAYQFDIVKRIDRAVKKGNFVEDLEKTKVVIDLWLSEAKGAKSHKTDHILNLIMECDKELTQEIQHKSDLRHGA